MCGCGPSTTIHISAGTIGHPSNTNSSDIAISAISCWEITKLVSQGRLTLHRPMPEWFAGALEGSGVRLLPLTPAIAIESNHLPGTFHRDPADCIIVATAHMHGARLLTIDRRISNIRT